MNFLKQNKLTKEEWEKIEKPINNEREKEVLKMIENGYNDEDSTYVPYPYLRSFLNIQSTFDPFVFEKILKPKLLKLNKKNCLLLEEKIPKESKKNILSKADQIRMKNSLELFETSEYDSIIIEFVLLQELKIVAKCIQKYPEYKKEKKYGIALYNIYLLHKNYNSQINCIFSELLQHVEDTFLKDIKSHDVLKHVSKYIEHNPILKYRTFSLYEHQKRICHLFKTYKNVPKFVFYCAPTSSGKTLSPLALSVEYKVLFVCASKHIGLSLAKSAYTLQKRIAFAFGCNDVEHIRLNYNAVHTYKENKHKMKVPDHSDGTNVDIMISDLTSFEHAMYYMKSFHALENIVVFWDEPTIGLDVEHHELHGAVKQIWDTNLIPNVILSCATLPKEEEIGNILSSFKNKFQDVQSEYIESYDQTTNLMIYDEYGNIVMPHMYFAVYEEMRSFLVYQGRKYFKFYNCNECAKFLLYYDKYVDSSYIQTHFATMDSFSLNHIKETYLSCLMGIPPEKWVSLCEHYETMYPLRSEPHPEIGCELTTKHARSLTNGPSLYISDNIQNICKYLLHIAKIEPKVLQTIAAKIKDNVQVSELLAKKRRDYEDKIEKFKDNEKVMEEMRFPQDIMDLHREITTMEGQIHALHIDAKFQPNRRDHYQKWHQHAENYDESDVYTSHVDDDSIKKVMQLYTIHELYKMLLLMGIGIFSNEIMPCAGSNADTVKEENNAYVERMKVLAEEKSLYLVIANSDYIYGTNYQFSHCYLGKDMKNMSQEKIIQCIGRIGRQERNKHFSFRFRSKEQINVLYRIPEESVEAKNMNALFQ